MSVIRPVLLFLALLALAGCVSEDHLPYYAAPNPYDNPAKDRDQMTLERTACYGFCPVYKVKVSERDILVFVGERFVTETGGAISKRLPDGSFDKLMRIAKTYGFSDFDAQYPDADGANCPQRATDMPSVVISYKAERLTHAVDLYQGCFGFAGREKLDAMIAEIDAVLDLDEWIGPREAFYGAKE
ncbi:MAG: DUF6438 domain-containing protein [Parvularculaceae bacterium]